MDWREPSRSTDDKANVKNASNLSSLADKLRNDVRSLVIMVALIAGLILWFATLGLTDRVIYRGVDQAWFEPGRVHLKTEPSGHYTIERNADFAAMKVGCVYDLNYKAEFGRRQRADRQKTVRRATLVGC
ncbi:MULTISPECIES: hypothetical protein [Bradyrhizobium]|uniref:hypothetical protein n=1 Tax=Bradyrhizobium TaxID=374 RepID=UPI00040EE670|nr:MULTISPECIES: hypothetical protein [Bradyrhizobium]WLB91942.1 hypothetical protein QIH91_17200 [Bradyrhizobium japonicum USDA 135]GLR98634.1 hypothetical protein GCM10007858_62770 [Bradyrhizobium liaoningense]